MIYKTYQEAKIENPKSNIAISKLDQLAIKSGDFVVCDDFSPPPKSVGYFNDYYDICDASEYLPTIKEFKESGKQLEIGDLVLTTSGEVVEVKIPAIWNDWDDGSDLRYVLKSASLESKIKTESPEEKEALDMIDTTSKRVESLANDSELANSSEWDGGLPPVGAECCFTPDNNLWGFASTDTYFGEVLKYEGEQFVFLLSHDEYNIRPCHLIVSRTDKGEFSKPESPEKKAERERLEAKDKFIKLAIDFSHFTGSTETELILIENMFDSGKFKLVESDD